MRCALPALLTLALLPACAGAPHSRTAAPGLSTGEHGLDVGDARLWYRVAGAGAEAPPVVFLHGGPGYNSHSFAVLAGPELEERLRMVYFDQRGSGRSERPPSGDYALSRLVEDIELLRRQLGVPRIALLGHSFGAVLALEYAARFPRHVSHLVIAAGLWDAPLQCRLRWERLARVRPDVHARVLQDTMDAEGRRRHDCELEFAGFTAAERERYQNAAMYPDSALEARQDSIDRASGLRNTGELGRALFQAGLLDYRFRAFDRITMPALVLAGGRDGAALSAGLRALAEALPDARFVEYPEAGHFLYTQDPERFAQDVAAFVRRR